MINFYKCCLENNIVIKGIKFIDNSVCIHSEDNNNYFIKNKNINLKELFDYFVAINFNSYLLPINIGDNYELYYLKNDLLVDNYGKAKELINCLIDLHSKSISYVEFTMEKKEQIYNLYNNNIEDVLSYYLKLQDFIEKMSFIFPAYYILLVNISKVYKLLKLSKFYLDKWYKSSNNRMREAFLVNNCDIKNFCYSDVKYFINWDSSKKDLIIFDFIDFYKKNCGHFDIVSLFDNYNSKINLSDDEISLLLVDICIPEKIDFKSSNYDNTLYVRKMISYVDITTKFVLEKYKEYQKTD